MARHKDLTPRQEAFVRAYLTNGRNATAAYKACYTTAGWAENSINQQAFRLMRLPKIAHRIDVVSENAAKKSELTVARLDQEIARVAFADVRGAYDEHGNLRPMKDWPDDVAAAIVGIETNEAMAGDKPISMVRKIRRASKTEALMLAARRLGVLREKIDVDVTINLETLVTAAAGKRQGLQIEGQAAQVEHHEDDAA